MMLYIHIPFCLSKCAYCDFYSRPPRSDDEAHRYVSTLLREWQLRRDEIPRQVETIYIGGGTPSLLPPREMDRLFEALPVHQATEVTVEANPEQINIDWLRWVNQSPINRLSVGIQSLSDDELRVIGRRHSASCAMEAIDSILRMGPSNFSLDLIYGLPGQSLESWTGTLNTVLDVRPPHMSCYMLTYEPRTRLEAMRKSGIITPTDDDTLASMYRLLCLEAALKGYEHYEISNFAQPGCRSEHNTGYWLNRPYVGLGAAAHSFDGYKRRFNPSNLGLYMSLDSTPVFETEEESDMERHNDLLLTSLRLTEGLDLDLYAKLYGDSMLQRLLDISDAHVKSGLMIRRNGRLGFTEHGWILSDAVLVDLFCD